MHPRSSTAGERGQALVLFVLLSLVLIGSVAIVTDVSWLWYGNQRMQRAADAAALAGAIYLPGDPAKAYSTARDEATKNGFTSGVNGVTVTPLQDTVNKRRLNVTVTGSVGAFFAQSLGISSFASSATGRAEYYLPVPMGSPENYYGVFGMTRGIADRADRDQHEHQLGRRRHRPAGPDDRSVRDLDGDQRHQAGRCVHRRTRPTSRRARTPPSSSSGHSGSACRHRRRTSRCPSWA